MPAPGPAEPPRHALLAGAADADRAPRVVDARRSGALGREMLYRVIGTVAQGPDLARVLPSIVDLLTDATACHACFVYLRDGDRLTMRAASAIHAAAVGRLSMGIDEGLCGWVVRHDQPAYIRDHALADPRTKAFPELQEERFQSMVAVPLRGRAGTVIGVISLNTEAPGEFGPEVLEFLEHVASLVAGAIENARTYERERDRVDGLQRLAALVQRIASVGDRAALLTSAVDGARELLGAQRSRLSLVGPDGVQGVAARSGDRPPADGAAVDDDAGAPGTLAVRVAAGDIALGVLAVERDAPFGRDEAWMLETVAGQLAVALRTVELIERLTEENLVRDLLDAIAEGRGEALADRARAVRIDPDRPHVVVVLAALEPTGWGGAPRAADRLRHELPGALCDAGPERIRALLPVAGGTAEELARIDARLDGLGREERLAVGRSSLQPGLAAGPASLAEAASAARVARALAPEGGARAWDGLGAYRYLAGVGGEAQPDARHARAISLLWEYDAERGTQLVGTLERYLADRSVVPTARALRIHANTLRQRLDRVETLTSLDLDDEDLLSLELAIKLHRLRAADRAAA